MAIVVECPSCGRQNRVEADKIKRASCGSCKEKLVEADSLPAGMTDEDIAEAVVAAPQEPQAEEVNTSAWLAKIGDYGQQESYVKKGFWSKVKRYAAKVAFVREAIAMYYCAMDSNTPIAVKATAIGALAYWILPIDLIPDFIPVAGFADDATAILIAYRAVSGHITSEHRQKAEQFLAE